MADSLVTLISSQGSTVKVSADQVDRLLEAGFTKPQPKTTAKKASSSKSSK